MAEGERQSLNIAAFEERIRRGFSLRGAFPVALGGDASPSVNIFNLDQCGYHVGAGRLFAGTDSCPAAVAGASKVLVKAGQACVVDRHYLSNTTGAIQTGTLRYLGPATADAFVYSGANTWWTEGITDPASAAINAPLPNAVSNDALTPGAVLWRGQIPALTTKDLYLPVELAVGARVLFLGEVLNAAIQYAWSGYIT